MERRNKLSIEMWDTASTITNTADTTSASTNSTAACNINTVKNFAVTTTTASIVTSIVTVTTTTASIVSVTTSTASNFVAATMVSTPVTTDRPPRGRGFIPGHGHFRNLGGFRGYSYREIERKMGGSSNQMLLSQVLQHWRRDVQKYYNPPGQRRRNKRGGQNSQGQRGLGGRGRRGGRGGQGGTGGMTI